MAFQLRGARQAYRSSEGTGVPPRSSPRADRQAAHRSAPAAAPPFDFSEAFTAPDSSSDEPRLRDRSLAADVPDTYRDSFVSIVDDPFFQRFDFEGATDTLDFSQLSPRDPSPAARLRDPDLRLDLDSDLDLDLSPGPGRDPRLEPGLEPGTRHDDGDDLRWPPHRRESLIIGHQSHPPPTAHVAVDDMDSLNIAVIGATGVGKSAFVQRVLGLSRPPISNASSVRLVVDNTSFGVTLLELDLEYFEVTPSHPIQWPKQINGHIVPRVDGALIVYDVTKGETMQDLPQTIAALTKSGLPAVLVANKCDTPESIRQVDTQRVANHEYFKACVATYNLSSSSPERARACLHTVLRAAVANRKDPQGAEPAAYRRRAASAANLEAPDVAANRPLSQQSKHSRASSDLSLLRGAVADHYRPSTRSPRLGTYANGLSNTIVETGTETPQQSFSNMLRTPGIRLDRNASDSFLDMDESDAESIRNSEDIPILLRHDESSGGRNTKVTTGVAFGDLVDRLLALKMSRADNNFLEIFLCLYRKFAAPGELFSAILFRLDKVRDDKSAHYLTKTATQLRIIEVVARWVSLYPGDFARPATRRNLEDFIRHLSTEPIFCTAARQIKQHLEHNVMEDDDTGWAKSDDVADREASKVLQKDSPRSMSDISNGVSSLYLDEVDLRPSGSSDLSIIDRSSSFVSYQSFDDYEREASTMEPTDVLPMNKFRYHIFMDIPEDHIAEELTRIDWVMFSSIRVRDFVRHVSLPLDQRAKCKSLKNVNRMINHFNHVAKWTANLTLLRDKPKHRAQMLEKFMAIAGKLRRLNNYNGLAAILAGINGTAVHRLTQTWALVPPDRQRAFAKLGILMGTQKSHFAYRLAWENSPLPRIPYMPLHRRDLVSAEEGSKTFVGPEGDRINWKKFEVLGEVILPIMKSQSTPYPNQTRHDSARELILDCRMPTDEEEIYQRSVQVESTSGGGADPAKKKFPWFAK
ncbi:RasGEF domain-containing protein [Plectosphaerella cucumerina]|uniref:RasGEF domain-containing protein n=1 Tax=Plectosphaerella cucumerina TaxID=40658 RepID=A0A8K0TI38_9PEZI|nr:RasGEF domain-containing protein [Plectosphaerella cucumerina]